ncbi:MAG: phospholipase D family protein [Desulfarculus sp.]|nr:phospholipase D family protein [Desulfarculus sp.]
MNALVLLLVGLLIWAVWPRTAGATGLHLDCPASVYFSPRGGAEAALVREIGAARQSVHVLAFSFTSQPIITALRQAAARGVAVAVVVNKSQDSARYAALRQGLPVRVDWAHAIAHNKVMILDEATVVTGSFNFTKSAEQRNAENLVIARCPNLAQLYLRDWEKHQAHSVAPGQRPAKKRVKASIGGGR